MSIKYQIVMFYVLTNHRQERNLLFQTPLLRYEGNCSVRRLASQGMDVSTWRVENVLTYSAKLQHSKSNVQCKALIKDDLNYTIRVPSGIYNGMTVMPRPGPSPFSTHGLSDWEIALIVVGVLVFVSVVIAISVVICFCFGLLCFSGRKKKSGRSDFRQNDVRDSTSSIRRSKVRSIVQYVDIDDLDKDKPIYINGYSSSPKAFKDKRKSSTKSPSFMKNIKSFDDKFSQDSTNVFTYEGRVVKGVLGKTILSFLEGKKQRYEHEKNNLASDSVTIDFNQTNICFAPCCLSDIITQPIRSLNKIFSYFFAQESSSSCPHTLGRKGGNDAVATLVKHMFPILMIK